jgi:carboxylesterase type B
MGASHFQEVAFVFNNKDGVGYGSSDMSPFYSKPKTFLDSSDQISEAWIRFIYDGNPGDFWPSYGSGDGNYNRSEVGQNYVFDAMVAGLGYVERDDWRRHGIELINSWNADVYDR